MDNHNLSRRLFLKTMGTGILCLELSSQTKAITVQTKSSVIASRHQVRLHQRRIIMNNDGNDLRQFEAGEAVTPESFLSKRTTALVGSQVDAIFYCTGVFNLYKHNTREAELHLRNDGEGDRVQALIDQGTDSLEIMTKFGHEQNIEVFWSMRMNDTHDSSNPNLFCKWKEEHPEYLVGQKDKKLPYGCNRWSSVDYGVPAVREKVFRIFEEVCTHYDIDGIEMDFFRHPVLFKPQMTGNPVTQSHCDMLTDLIRRVRKMTDTLAAKRRRPILIAIRIPDSVGYCKALGIDLITWLGEDLVDIINGGGYFKLEPWENLVALGKKYNVPVYACLVARRLMDGGQAEAKTAIKKWRGEALNAWKAGVNGIYTFNRFDPTDPIFRELGDPTLLETLERIDQTSYVADIWSRPETWLKDGDKYVKKPIK